MRMRKKVFWFILKKSSRFALLCLKSMHKGISVLDHKYKTLRGAQLNFVETRDKFGFLFDMLWFENSTIKNITVCTISKCFLWSLFVAHSLRVASILWKPLIIMWSTMQIQYCSLRVVWYTRTVTYALGCLFRRDRLLVIYKHWLQHILHFV